MRTVLAMTLLFASSFAWAAANPADYPLSAHVSSSRLDTQYQGQNQATNLILDVLIAGKKYQLEASRVRISASTVGLIVPGDYKAKLTSEKRKGTYAYAAEYELLFPDGSTKKFEVIGMSE